MRKIPLLTLLLVSPIAVAIEGINGKYVVGYGPVTLGKMSITTHCGAQTCRYKSRAKGSFLFIDADVKEQGSYRQKDELITPIAASYEEKIGSKHRSYSYDFLTMDMNNRLKNKQTKMTELAYPFITLLNQVALDLKSKGPAKEYSYVIKQKIKQVVLGNYEKKTFEGGLRHYITIAKKDSELEFVFLQVGDKIKLEKLYYGSFWMTAKKASK